jgi:hypothetical protein
MCAPILKSRDPEHGPAAHAPPRPEGRVAMNEHLGENKSRVNVIDMYRTL